MTGQQIDRDQLRALAGRASRGPWTANNGYVSAAEGRDGIAGNCMDVDAEFIAASRQAVPALLDALDQAEARIQAIRELHQARPNSCSALYPSPLCSCGYDYPCDTIRALDGDQ